MKLTRKAFQERPESERRWIGDRPAVMRRHLATRELVIEPVTIVERLLPRDCEHDRLRVVRAGIFARTFMARCADCGAAGPVVPAAISGLEVAKAARSAFLAEHPRAGFREAIDDSGVRWGWAERVGGRWVCFSSAGSDAPKTCVGAFPDPDSAIAAVFARWRRTPTGGVDQRPGCHHCSADPLEVSEFCPSCALPVCGACFSESNELTCGRSKAAS